MSNLFANQAPLLRTKTAPAAAALIASAGIIYGLVLCCINSLETFAVSFLAVLLAAILALWTFVRMAVKENDRGLLVTGAACMTAIIIVTVMPEGLPASFHVYRSFVAAALIIGLCVATLCSAVYRLLGSTPVAFDNSRYPILILPIVIALISYGMILFVLCLNGLPQISWQLISTPYDPANAALRGILNDILGTFMLMLLTSIISLPVGVGAGIYMSEYGGRIAGIIRFSTMLLRAMPVVVLGLAAYGVARMAYDTAWQGILAPDPTIMIGRGTFLLASAFLSLLVIPVITRATEEGLRSLPRDLREGSLAVGATEGYTLLHVLLPWSLPNILTGLLLGCAEVAGNVTVIVLLCGFGNYGVTPFTEATSLAHFIYKVMFADRSFRMSMGNYVYAVSVILLIITLGLTIVYLVLRNKFAERYRAH